MALDFPESPNPGDLFPVAAPRWQWDGAKWSALATGVLTFNGRSGSVALAASDISGADGALLASPVFTGTPQAPTAAIGTSNQQVATTAFVANAVVAGNIGVSTWEGRAGAVLLTANDISARGGALLASPIFTGVPTAPTASAGTNTQQLATTAFVTSAIGALLVSPQFTGIPTAPTAAPATNTTQIATTAFVHASVVAGAGVTTFNTRTGAVTLTTADITGAGGAPLASPAFTGTPTAPTLQLTGAAGIRYSTASPIADGASISFDFNTSQYALKWTRGTGYVQNVLLDGSLSTLAVAYQCTSVGVFSTSPLLGILYVNSGAAYTWPMNTTSDRRLKHNIKQATVDALALLRKLTVYSCDFPVTVGAEVTHSEAAIMADEVKDLIPQAYVPSVTFRRSAGDPEQESYESLLELPLVAMLIRAVHQLTERIERLEGAGG